MFTKLRMVNIYIFDIFITEITIIPYSNLYPGLSLVSPKEAEEYKIKSGEPEKYKLSLRIDLSNRRRLLELKEELSKIKSKDNIILELYNSIAPNKYHRYSAVLKQATYYYSEPEPYYTDCGILEFKDAVLLEREYE